MKIFILLLHTVLSFGVNYDIVLEENIFHPCKEYPEKQYLDISNVTVTTLDDESVYIKGTTTIITDLPDIITINIEVYKKKRGDWENTIYTLYRPDFCRALWSPKEIWHKLLKSIPKELRQCPLKKGMKFAFDTKCDLDINIQDKKIDGEYKFRLIFNIGLQKSADVCYEIYSNIYRA